MKPNVIHCPVCAHPINSHRESCADCSCRVDPNTIALAAVQTALFGELTK